MRLTQKFWLYFFTFSLIFLSACIRVNVPLPTATPAPSITPTPSPSPVPIPEPVLLPDLKPYIPLGWEAPVALLSSDDSVLKAAAYYRGNISIGIAITNAGPEIASTFYTELHVNGKVAYIWNLAGLSPGETANEKIPLDYIIDYLSLKPGKHILTLRVDGGGYILERDKSNNSYSFNIDITAARPPVTRRAPQSPEEVKIQKMFDEYTWISNANIEEVMAIAREIFKDIPIEWSTVKVNVLPFAEFNIRYGDTFGATPAEKRRSAESIASTPLTGYAFIQGTPQQQLITVREGLLVQVLPFILRELGGAHYIKRNPRAQTRASTVPNQELVVELSELYGLQELRERYGWNGLTNVSYLMNDNLQFLASSFLSSSNLVGTTIRIPWLIAMDSGHPQSAVPSNIWLRTYLQFVSMSEPISYINDIVERTLAMPHEPIISTLESRVVDKELTTVPEHIREKLDPEKKYGNELSLDLILVNQLSFFRP